jgi:hypothetical protein
MKKHFYAAASCLILCLNSFTGNSQTLIQDRWDTLYANVDYANTTKYLYQHDVLKFGNDLAILCDSGDYYTDGSYLQIFNTSNNALTTVNYPRMYVDKGSNAGAVYSSTTGVNYLFWGTRLNSNVNTNWGLYNYNSQTNAVSSESVNLPLNIHRGVMNLGFYSPATNDDSLTIFAGQSLSSTDSIYIYRKHVNQSGFVNTGVKLPIQLDLITKVFNFNGQMYVAGYSYPYDGQLLKSNDGITFTVETSYSTNYQYEYIVDADVMNNKLYFGTFSGNPGYKIVETPDGTNFTTLVSNTDPRGFASLECFDNTVWYSHYLFMGNKPGPSASTNFYSFDAPSVGYLNMSNNTEIQSCDTLGRSYNDGKTFMLKKVNNRLLMSGNYYYSTQNPGNFIYEFIPPVANFSIPGNTLCANVPYTFNENCTATDSVRWFIDNNFYFSTTNSMNSSFSAGNHTIGLIAISGTQQDTMQYAISAYSIGIQMNPSINGCMNNTIALYPVPIGAVSPLTYTWTCSAALTQTSLSSPTLFVVAAAPATYTYDLLLTDANGCIGGAGNHLLNIFSNTDLNGAVDVASVPLTSGNVILYKYEPVLTQFDSVNYQPLNSSGTFTFTQNDAYTYIIACEPTSNTLQTTYAPSEISWKTATVVSHGCFNNTTQNLSVIPILNIGTGTGVLSGKITEGQGYGARGANVNAPGSPIGGLSIKGGRNPGGNIVAQGRTDGSGGYTLTGLPASGPGEHYFILVDVPGLDTNNTYHRAINTNSMAFTNLDFVVDSAKINPTYYTANVKEIKFEDQMVTIYPNPTNGILHMNFELKQAENISIKLSDINGKMIRTILPSDQYFGTDLKMHTDVSDLKSGVYLMQIRIGDADRTAKIVITH